MKEIECMMNSSSYLIKHSRISLQKTSPYKLPFLIKVSAPNCFQISLYCKEHFPRFTFLSMITVSWLVDQTNTLLHQYMNWTEDPFIHISFFTSVQFNIKTKLTHRPSHWCFYSYYRSSVLVRVQ
jgi:hypothetical protein